MTGVSRAARRFGVGVLVAAFLAAPASAETAGEASGLNGSCFAQNFDRRYLAQHPRQRVAAIAVQFHGFDGSLLASVAYRLRYGTKFAFSSDCRAVAEGYFLCAGCTNGNCGAEGGEKFAIAWPGGDGLELDNDLSGLLGGNSAGGRDYLISLREQSAFLLERGEPADCAW
jgi:hypothetical protein